MRSLGVVVLVVACGGGGGARSSETPAHRDNSGEVQAVDPKLLAEVAAGLEEVLGAMAQITDGADCPTMGAELHQLFERSAPLFELARAQEASPEAAAILTAEMDARAVRVKPLVDRIGTGLARCKDDPSVVEAVRTMPTF